MIPMPQLCSYSLNVGDTKRQNQEDSKGNRNSIEQNQKAQEQQYNENLSCSKNNENYQHHAVEILNQHEQDDKGSDGPQLIIEEEKIKYLSQLCKEKAKNENHNQQMQQLLSGYRFISTIIKEKGEQFLHQRIFPFISVIRKKQGEVLYQQDSQIDGFFLILKGRCEGKIFNKHSGENRSKVEVYQENYILGQLELIDQRPKYFTIISSQTSYFLYFNSWRPIQGFLHQQSQNLVLLMKRFPCFSEQRNRHLYIYMQLLSYQQYSINTKIYSIAQKTQYIYFILSGDFKIFQNVIIKGNEPTLEFITSTSPKYFPEEPSIFSMKTEVIFILFYYLFMFNSMQVSHLCKGHVFGEEEILSGKNIREQEVVCASNKGEVLMLHKSDFNFRFARDPWFLEVFEEVASLKKQFKDKRLNEIVNVSKKCIQKEKQLKISTSDFVQKQKTGLEERLKDMQRKQVIKAKLECQTDMGNYPEQSFTQQYCPMRKTGFSNSYILPNARNMTPIETNRKNSSNCYTQPGRASTSWDQMSNQIQDTQNSEIFLDLSSRKTSHMRYRKHSNSPINTPQINQQANYLDSRLNKRKESNQSKLIQLSKIFQNSFFRTIDELPSADKGEKPRRLLTSYQNNRKGSSDQNQYNFQIDFDDINAMDTKRNNSSRQSPQTEYIFEEGITKDKPNIFYENSANVIVVQDIIRSPRLIEELKQQQMNKNSSQKDHKSKDRPDEQREKETFQEILKTVNKRNLKAHLFKKNLISDSDNKQIYNKCIRLPLEQQANSLINVRAKSDIKMKQSSYDIIFLNSDQRTRNTSSHISNYNKPNLELQQINELNNLKMQHIQMKKELIYSIKQSRMSPDKKGASPISYSRKNSMNRRQLQFVQE